MATTLYFEHQKTGKRFKVLGQDPEKGTVKLEGEYRVWDELFDKAAFKKMGYTLKQIEE